MKPGREVTLGDLQLAIMRVLWESREATSADVHAALEESHGLAPTTIATMLAKMERKGVVRHRAEGRRFIYAPTVTEEQVKGSMVRQLTRRLFEGDPMALVSHLLSRGEIDEAEMRELKELLARGHEGRRR